MDGPGRLADRPWSRLVALGLVGGIEQHSCEIPDRFGRHSHIDDLAMRSITPRRLRLQVNDKLDLPQPNGPGRQKQLPPSLPVILALDPDGASARPWIAIRQAKGMHLVFGAGLSFLKLFNGPGVEGGVSADHFSRLSQVGQRLIQQCKATASRPADGCPPHYPAEGG
ncbi:hypothetical protein ACRAWD_11460 [Caulobacter segnis]